MLSLLLGPPRVRVLALTLALASASAASPPDLGSPLAPPQDLTPAASPPAVPSTPSAPSTPGPPSTPMVPSTPSAASTPAAPSTPTAPTAPDAAPTTEPPRYSAPWVDAQLRDLHARYPRLTRLVQLGTSNEGRPIWALAIGRKLRRNDPRPAVLLNGAHHGVELMSIDMVLDAMEVLLLRSGTRRERAATPATSPPGGPPPRALASTADPVLRRDPALDRRVARWLDELVVWCVPAVNPDGVWATLNGHPRTGRKNGRDTDSNGRIDATDGVDLNRNYPFRWGALGEVGSSSKPQSFYYRGAEPGSEPETRAMMRIAESEHFVASISYHTGTVAVLAPYTIDNVKDPTPNEAWLVGEQLVASLPPHPQGRLFSLRHKLYSVDGTDQDYYRARFGTLAYLVEGARRDAKDAAERYAVVHAVRPSWMQLFDRYLDGPTISGKVIDASGQPVVAAVSLAEQTAGEGEVWQTRCRDGRFDRFLPAPGRYTLRVQAEGTPAVEQVVDVQAGRTQVQITLPTIVRRATCPAAPRDEKS